MRNTAITIPWADGEYRFDLRLGEVRKVQDATGIGIPVIVRNLQSDNFKVDEFREVILQGLLGGGMDATDARLLVKKWVDERPARESVLPAIAICMAWLVGVPEGKTDAVKVNESPAVTAPGDSISPHSMEQVPQSDSAHAT